MKRGQTFRPVGDSIVPVIKPQHAPGIDKEDNMAISAKLTQQELVALVKDLDVSDEEIAKYFILDEENSDAFSPKVIPNPDLVEDNGLEGAFILNSFNRLARWRRNAIYKRRMKNWDGIRIVAEGDSWFQYPLMLKDTIDHLIDLDQFEYAIYGLSEAGDLLANIVSEDEITWALEKENPDVFLISGGGNDMVGNSRMATMVHKYSANRLPENYPNPLFGQFLDELERLYRDLFSRLLTAQPHLKIICHGYDKAIPSKGKWLGKPLEKQNIKDGDLQRQIVAIMIDRFNERLQSIIGDFSGSVFHVDCRDLIGDKPKWHDELHPENDGYFKVANKFDKAIKQALATTTASPAIELATTVETAPFRAGQPPIMLARSRKLDNNEYLNLVVSRAKTITGKSIATPTNRAQRKEIERDISEFYEKIHKEANFLPSNFLEKGVRCAKAVCRITTDTSYGSGFLLANRNLIMTNNHVLSNNNVAAVSVAEFDYDEDDIIYRVNFRPDLFFMTDGELDFTIVACDPAPIPLNIQPIVLLRDKDTITREERVNIVQHPRGRRKEVSLHDNKVSYIYDIAIRYTADTEGGSSGSPVFNNSWELVALHHAGWSNPDGTATNEGIRISSIVEYLINQNSTGSSDILTELLDNVTYRTERGPSTPQVVGRKPPVSPVTSPAQDKGKQDVTLNIGTGINNLTINIGNTTS